MNLDPDFENLLLQTRSSQEDPLTGDAQPWRTLEVNSIYMARVRAVEQSTNSRQECAAALHLGYADDGSAFSIQRTIEINVPIVSDSEATYGKPGEWFEQFLFFRTDEVSNALAWSCDPPAFDIKLVIDVVQLFLDSARYEAVEKLLPVMQRKKAKFNGKTYLAFSGTEVVSEYIAEQEKLRSQKSFPSLTGGAALKQTYRLFDDLLVGVVGDDLLADGLNSCFPCIKVGTAALPAIRNNALDLILIQSRSNGIAPAISSQEDESVFLGELADTLVNSQIPIFELSPQDGSRFSSLRNLIAGHEAVITGVLEHELYRATPAIGGTWNPRTVVIPCASDLYQYPEYQEMAARLVTSGFPLVICEYNYDHVPKRTLERFPPESVKIYGRLSTEQMAELFQNSGFVVLPGRSLRSHADLANLAALALMSGSLPISFSPRAAGEFGEWVQDIWGYRPLHHYLSQQSAVLLRERHWLRKFRIMHRNVRSGGFLAALNKVVSHHFPTTCPSAEMICISKRPSNVDKIMANFCRQKYSNLGMHLIWNVPSEQAAYCIDISKKIRALGVRVTVLDETNNIGACLNYGRRESVADFWFKIDDDDYYGSNYIEDMVMFYEYAGCDSAGKPSSFVLFNDSNEIYLRDHASRQVRRPLGKGKYFCGATLSGRRASRLPLFSTTHRNSCDSHWVEKLQAEQCSVFIADFFNFVICRGEPNQHTWQIADKSLKEKASLIFSHANTEWFDAE